MSATIDTAIKLIDIAIKVITVLCLATLSIVMICGWVYRRAFILSFGIDTAGMDTETSLSDQFSYVHYGLLVIRGMWYDLENGLMRGIYDYCLYVFFFFILICIITFAVIKFAPHVKLDVCRIKYYTFVVLLISIFGIFARVSLMSINQAGNYGRYEAQKIVILDKLPTVKFHFVDKSQNLHLKTLSEKMNHNRLRKIFMDKKNLYVYDSYSVTRNFIASIQKNQADERANGEMPMEVTIIPLDKIAGVTIVSAL